MIKECTGCGLLKHISEYHRSRINANGKCKSCISLYNKNYISKNRERRLQTSNNWKANNKEKYNSAIKNWAKNNPEKTKMHYKKWRSNNRDRISEIKVARYRSTVMAVPSWADKEIVRNFYIEAEYQQMTVDHIVPIRSKIVCGLHWEGNLQLLSNNDNRVKGNRFWPDMP